MNGPKILILSTSLHSASRSRLLAKLAQNQLNTNSDCDSVRLIDLAQLPLPLCDGEGSYQDANVLKLNQLVAESDGFLIAGPIYNYDLGAAAKNMIELVGKQMADKPVGFLCAAGGQGSFMAPMSFAASLMLDFRCLVVPRFVYATGSDFHGNEIGNPEIAGRIQHLCDQLTGLAGFTKSQNGS